MKRITFHLFLPLVLICQFSKVNGQEPLKEQAKNVIYVSAGVPGYAIAASVNYERLLFSKDQKYKGNYYIKASYGTIDQTFGALTLQRVFGLRKHHLEMGLGVVIYPIRNPWRVRPISQQTVFPAGAIGYRYQKPKGGFVFRTGLGFIDGIYLSFGTAF